MKIIHSVFLLLFVSFLHAQDKNRFRGQVRNEQTGAPIPNASMYITNTTHGTVTNKHGRFEMHNVLAGNFELKISYIGFRTKKYPFATDNLLLKLGILLQT